MLQASFIAIRNNQKEKLEALENAVMNSALLNFPDEIFQEIYISLIDLISTLHISMLKEINGMVLNIKDTNKFLNETFPKMENEQNLYKHIWQDLIAKDLISMETEDNMGCTITRTPLGNGFLDFISQKHCQ